MWAKYSNTMNMWAKYSDIEYICELNIVTQWILRAKYSNTEYICELNIVTQIIYVCIHVYCFVNGIWNMGENCFAKCIWIWQIVLLMVYTQVKNG